MGVVRFIGSGRAQVDFNHRLAGKTLIYDVEVVRKVETEEEKVRSLIKRRFPGELGDKVEFTLEPTELTVEIPEMCIRDRYNGEEGRGPDGLPSALAERTVDLKKSQPMPPRKPAGTRHPENRLNSQRNSD